MLKNERFSFSILHRQRIEPDVARCQPNRRDTMEPKFFRMSQNNLLCTLIWYWTFRLATSFKGRLSYHLCVECFSQLSFCIHFWIKWELWKTFDTKMIGWTHFRRKNFYDFKKDFAPFRLRFRVLIVGPKLLLLDL